MRRLWLLGLGVYLASSPTLRQASAQVVREWLTLPDRSSLVAETPSLTMGVAAAGNGIVVDASQGMQTVEGFGFALTGGSAELMMRLPRRQRLALERELVGPGGIGVGYLRVSIGSSDMDARAFTCDDLPPGETDAPLRHFTLGAYRRTVLPVLREMLHIDPRLRLLGSPWSAPAWMKTDHALRGGELDPAYEFAYARYLVRWVQAMRAEGVDVAAITMQNEPLNPNNTPSMVMPATQQRDLLRDALGPALRRAHLSTKVFVYDHNPDRPQYPETVLTDAGAAQYAAGSAFHLYAGAADAMTEVHDRFPDKGIYFTEQMVVDLPNATQLAIAQPVAHVAVDALRNWARTVLLWNLAADAHFGPHTHGGCPVCEGALTIDGTRVTRNLAFYTVAQAAKFVPPGSVRVASTEAPGVSDAAFVRPDGKTVLVVANTSAVQKDVPVREGQRGFVASLPPGAAATFVW